MIITIKDEVVLNARSNAFVSGNLSKEERTISLDI